MSAEFLNRRVCVSSVRSSAEEADPVLDSSCGNKDVTLSPLSLCHDFYCVCVCVGECESESLCF